jgi:two-component system NtrC family sensor kinase
VFLESILLLSRKGEAAKEMIDAGSAIRDLLPLVTSQAKLKAIKIESEFEDDLPKIYANRSSLQQVIINLCNNALDAIANKGTVRLSAALNGEYIEIKVNDNGSGMSEEARKHLFEPFYTTKEAGKGTGLGLSISSDIVRNHGGSIEVESEIGKGTVFTVRLPVKQQV